MKMEQQPMIPTRRLEARRKTPKTITAQLMTPMDSYMTKRELRAQQRSTRMDTRLNDHTRVVKRLAQLRLKMVHTKLMDMQARLKACYMQVWTKVRTELKKPD
jgi:hypothetical protein